MARRRPRALLLLALAMAGAVSLVVPLGIPGLSARAAVASPVPCGDPLLLGASWQIPGGGVDIESNGGYEGQGVDCVDPSGTPENSVPSSLPGVGNVVTGEEWQCTELVNRLYVTKGWIAATWHGNGGDSAEGANDSMYDLAPTGLFKQPNGSITYLGPGDVVSENSFTATTGAFVKFGHVLVVNSQAVITSGAVPLVSQNAGGPSSPDVTTTAYLSNGTLTIPATVSRSHQVIGAVHAPPNAPQVSWSFSAGHTSAGKAVGLSYQVGPVFVPGEELTLQRQFGTAQTWATFANVSLTQASGTWETPGEPLGSYGYRVRLLLNGGVLDQSPVQYLHTYGPVGLQPLCSAPGASNNSMNGCPAAGTAPLGFGHFKYAAHVSNNHDSVYPAFWDLLNFPATSCSSVTLSFAMPTGGSVEGDTAYLRVTQHGAKALTASVPYGAPSTLTAPLDGAPWQVGNSATSQDDQIVINATAICYTANGQR